MSTADEFKKWREIFDSAQVDSDGDSPIGDLAWIAMRSLVEGLEEGRPVDELVADARGNWNAWVAFWLSAGCVISVVAWRMLP